MKISEFIYSWLRDLIVLFVMISLMDLVMPKGSMKKYINFVIGLLIIFTVVNPLINISKIDFNLDKEVFKNLENNVPTYGNDYTLAEQTKQIEAVFKGKLIKEIGELVSQNTKYNIFDIEVNIDKSEENFGFINGINIILSEEGEEANEKDIQIKVKPVVFESPKLEENNMGEFNELKTLISNKYDIDIESINISMKKQGG